MGLERMTHVFLGVISLLLLLLIMGLNQMVYIFLAISLPFVVCLFVCWVERHLPVAVMCIWALPGVLLFLHYLSARGCGFNTTRPYMETCGLCLSNSQNNNTIRLLKFWEDQPSITDHSETHSYYIQTIILSHLSMEDAQLTLQDQAIKLRVALPDGLEEDKVMDTLSKLYVLPHQFSESLFSVSWIRSAKIELPGLAMIKS